MKKNWIFYIWVGLQITVVKAELDEMGLGARSPGMSEAFVAVADDASSLYYNPAGLAQISSPELMMSNKQLMPALTDNSQVEMNSLVFVQPIRSSLHGTLAFSYQDFKGAQFFNDQMIRAGWGWTLPGSEQGSRGKFSLGLGLTYMDRRYKATPYNENSLDDFGLATGDPDPYFSDNGLSYGRMGLDAGFLYQLDGKLKNSAGLSFSNIGQKTISSDSAAAKGPVATRFGWACRPSWGLVSTEVRRIRRLSSSVDTEAAVGLEKQFILAGSSQFSIRGGYAQGSRDFESITTGLSFGMKFFRLDYAFQFPLQNIPEAGGEHTFALLFKFSSPASSPVTSGRLTRKNSKEMELTNAYQRSMNQYFLRKQAGASSYEKLSLLQDLVSQYGQNKVDMKWFNQELASL